MKAQQSLDNRAATANALDLEQPVNLISKEASVFGVPGFDVIGYDDGFNQCKHEFENKQLKQVSYKGLSVRAETPDRVMFRSIETVEGADGTVNTNGIQLIIRKEDGGVWRVSQERLLRAEEPENGIRRGAL